MNRIVLALGVLALSMLACGQYVGTPTPASTPTTQPAPLIHDTPTAAPTDTPAPLATEAGTAKVRAAFVNVRTSPNGDVVRQLEAGQEVTVIGCAESWCEVETEGVHGYIFEGCLDVETELKCEAK